MDRFPSGKKKRGQDEQHGHVYLHNANSLFLYSLITCKINQREETRMSHLERVGYYLTAIIKLFDMFKI